MQKVAGLSSRRMRRGGGSKDGARFNLAQELVLNPWPPFEPLSWLPLGLHWPKSGGAVRPHPWSTLWDSWMVGAGQGGHLEMGLSELGLGSP